MWPHRRAMTSPASTRVTSWRSLLSAAPVAMVAGWTLVLGTEWGAFQPWGWPPVHKLAEVGFLGAGVLPLMAGALIASGWAEVLGIPKRAAGAVVVLGIVWFAVTLPIHRSLRQSAVPRVEASARPVVDAIQAFTRRAGRPPSSLAELVPADLPAIPRTGLGAFPAFEYERLGHGHPSAETDDPWRLYVRTPFGGNSDIVVFVPGGRYPGAGWGGTVVPIGGWAYVWE